MPVFDTMTAAQIDVKEPPKKSRRPPVRGRRSRPAPRPHHPFQFSITSFAARKASIPAGTPQ